MIAAGQEFIENIEKGKTRKVTQVEIENSHRAREYLTF